jgi:outer membrane cobalamin receptor
VKKVIVMILLLFQFQIGLISQTITGKVVESKSENELPLIGATVQQLGTYNGVVTDKSGNFSINMLNNKPTSLIVSYVGYVQDTIIPDLNSGRELLIVMKEKAQLNEVEIVSRRKGSSISRTETRTVTNINENELQKAACCNLSESFENSATVDVSYGDAVTGAKQIKMLGLAGIYTQILTENIPNMRGLSTPWGLGYIPGSWMESIQVSKGTSSVINGYESMAGQINVEFKKARSDEKFFLNMYGNQFGKVEGNANASFELSEKWSTAILAHVENMGVKHDRNGDSFLDQPLISQVNLFNRWLYTSGQIRTRFGIKYLTEERIGGQSTYDPDKPETPENGYGIKVNTERIESFLKVGWISPDRVNTSIGFQNQFTYHVQNSNFGLNLYDATQISYYGNLMYQSWISNSNHLYTTGISFNYDNYDENLNDSLFYKTEIVYGGFFQYTYSNRKNLNVIAGIRVDNNSLYGVLVTPRIHAKYNINEHNIVRGSIGKGYRSPNIIAENTSLLATSKRLIVKEQPKIESSWNAGISYSRYFDISARELVLTADIFRTQFDNQIVVDRDSDPFEVYFYNLNGPSYSNSMQIEASYELFRNIETTIAFRYNDVKTTINNELVEKPLVNKFKGLLAVSYQDRKKTWQVDFNVQAIGTQRLPYTGYNPREYQLADHSPNYILLNAQITRYWKRLEVYLGGENLGNYRQTDPIISADDPFGKYFDSSIIWGPINGIKVYAGFRFKILANHDHDNHDDH